jgi:histidinol-phosphate aminotransferase
MALPREVVSFSRGAPMTSSMPQPKPGILDISPYVPGESSVPGGLKPIKLS